MMEDPKVQLIWHPNGVGNGVPIAEMALIAKEDLVMLLEDDGFIFTPGKVNECFERIESGEFDALGSPRQSCGKQVYEALREKYNLDYSGEGDRGPNYWPNFFFCKRVDLLNTDMNFASKEFTKGVYYPEFNAMMEESEYGDTFVWAGIQMRFRGVQFGDIPQFHASPNEIEEWETKRFNWKDGLKPYWIHGGSLSAGIGGYLSGNIPDTSNLGAKMEIESRVAFWLICLEQSNGEFGAYDEVYAKGIDDLIMNAKLSSDRIERKKNIYSALMQI